MKFFRAAVLTLLFITGGWGCEVGDDCGPFPTTYYDVTGFTGQNKKLNEQGYRNAESLPDNAEVSFAQFALAIYPTTEVISSSGNTPALGGVSTAYACSPPNPEPSERVRDIAVFSDTDFGQAASDKVLMAGDTLNGLFQIADFYSGKITGLTTFLNQEEEIAATGEGFFLILLTQPKEATTHQFTVHYRLDNDEFYTFTAPPVTVLP
jgi:hypothetical protein